MNLYNISTLRRITAKTIKILGSILTAPNKEEPDAEVKAQGIQASLDYDVAAYNPDHDPDSQMIVMLMVVASVYTACYFPINIVWVRLQLSYLLS